MKVITKLTAAAVGAGVVIRRAPTPAGKALDAITRRADREGVL